MNSLSFSRKCNEFTLSLFRYYSINSLSVLRIHYLFREFTMNLHDFSQFTLNFRVVTMNSLSFSRIHYKLIIFIRNSVRIHLIFRIHYDSSLCFAYILWIYYLLNEFTLNSLWIHLVIRYFLLWIYFFSLINYEFTIFFANSL